MGKGVSFWLVVASILAAGVFGVYQNGLVHSLPGAVPGVLLCFLAVWQPKVLGKGDGLVAIAYGCLYGWRNTVIWLMYSFLLVAIVGVFAKVLSRKKRLQLPFVPFMSLVHMGMCL